MSSGQRIELLLRRFGFEENPFGLREADREGRERLAAYFFQHPLFQMVLGRADALESTIVFAERGAGKTTFRQAIEVYCRAGRARWQAFSTWRMSISVVPSCTAGAQTGG